MKSWKNSQKSQAHKRDGSARSVFCLSKCLEPAHRQNTDRNGTKSNHVASLSCWIAAKREKNNRQKSKKSVKQDSSVVELFGMFSDFGRVAADSVEVKWKRETKSGRQGCTKFAFCEVFACENFVRILRKLCESERGSAKRCECEISQNFRKKCEFCEFRMRKHIPGGRSNW